jgi:molybdenum cofactor synthesis domain-containing protein
LGKILVAILTASDKGSRGEREDRSAQVIRELVAGIDGEVVAYDVVPDERKVLAEKLVQYADLEQVDLVLTTGGTGLGPRDVTPEATMDVESSRYLKLQPKPFPPVPEQQPLKESCYPHHRKKPQ